MEQQLSAEEILEESTRIFRKRYPDEPVPTEDLRQTAVDASNAHDERRIDFWRKVVNNNGIRNLKDDPELRVIFQAIEVTTAALDVLLARYN